MRPNTTRIGRRFCSGARGSGCSELSRSLSRSRAGCEPGTLNLNLPLLIAFGLLDTLANAMWAVASTSGLLSVVAVLGGVFPAVTVLLALVILKEPLERVQAIGVVITIIGGVMLTAG